MIFRYYQHSVSIRWEAHLLQPLGRMVIVTKNNSNLVGSSICIFQVCFISQSRPKRERNGVQQKCGYKLQCSSTEPHNSHHHHSPSKNYHQEDGETPVCVTLSFLLREWIAASTYIFLRTILILPLSWFRSLTRNWSRAFQDFRWQLQQESRTEGRGQGKAYGGPCLTQQLGGSS